MTKRIIFIATASVLALFIMASCGKKKDKCDFPECTVLMKKTWKFDAEAVRTFALTKAGKNSGITNLKDIKLKKDVKKIADFLQAKSLYFAYGKGKFSHRLVCAVTTGKSLLKSKRTGYWKLVDNGKTLQIDLYGRKKVEKLSYKILELTEKKFAILKKGATVPEVYVR